MAVGDRVYVNPWLSCGMCSYCRAGEPMLCEAAAFQGYFGFFPHSVRQLMAYPFGGFSEYMTASSQRLVLLPQQVTFDKPRASAISARPSRRCVLGRSAAAVGLRSTASPGRWGSAPHCLPWDWERHAFSVLAANRDVLARLKAIAPDQIEVLALGDASIAEWVRRHTDQLGVDVLVDCSARSAAAANTAEALAALKRGAVAVNIGALTEPLAIQPIRFMTGRLQFRGSNWFTTGEGRLMAEMAKVGVLDLSMLETRAYPLAKVNDALAEVQKRPGGFVNVVVNPDL